MIRILSNIVYGLKQCTFQNPYMRNQKKESKSLVKKDVRQDQQEAAGTNRQPCGATMWSVPLNFSPQFQQDKVRLVHDSWRSGRQRLGLADDRLRRCHANIARLGAPSGPGGDGSKHVDLIICFKNSLRASKNTQF